MAYNENIFRDEWIQQGPRPNCGSCCIASIVNYARRIRPNGGIVEMDENHYIGLAVARAPDLGSVSSRISQWLRATHLHSFVVAEVKVANNRAHWGGLVNRATGGRTGRPRVRPNQNDYWDPHGHRFLLREFSAMVFAGHFIIQTGVDEFWDPNRNAGANPWDLAATQAFHGALVERADALQIDVVVP